MADSVSNGIRIRLDWRRAMNYSKFASPLSWLFVDKTDVRNILQLKSFIRSRFFSGTVDFEFYLQQYLLPDSEPIEILRDDDLIEIRVVGDKSASSCVEDLGDLKDETTASDSSPKKTEKKRKSKLEDLKVRGDPTSDVREVKRKKKKCKEAQDAVFSNGNENPVTEKISPVLREKSDLRFSQGDGVDEILQNKKSSKLKPEANGCEKVLHGFYAKLNLSEKFTEIERNSFASTTSSSKTGLESKAKDVTVVSCSANIERKTKTVPVFLPLDSVSSNDSKTFVDASTNDESTKNFEEIQEPNSKTKRKRKNRKRNRTKTTPVPIPMPMDVSSNVDTTVNSIVPVGCGKHIRFDEDSALFDGDLQSLEQNDTQENIPENQNSFVSNDLQNSIGKDSDVSPSPKSYRFWEMSKEKQINSVCTNKSIILLNCFGAYTQSTSTPNNSPTINGDEVKSSRAMTKSPKDYQEYPQLNGPPRTGDHIAYKILELSSTYCPEVSDYKEGQVLNIKNDTIDIKLMDHVKKMKPPGKFELYYSDEEGTEERTDIVQVNWSDMLEPRLLNMPSSKM